MNMKNKILKTKTIDDLYDIEDEYLVSVRDNFYNELLKDEDVKKHICDLFNIDDEVIDNVLVINGAPPLDYFLEDEM